MSETYYGPKTVSKALFNEQLVDSPPPVVAVDIETISLKERMPIGFSIATSPDESWYFHTYPEADRELELVWPLLRNPAIKKVFHNAIFDLRSFPLIGDIDMTNIADTNVMARLLGKSDTKLFELAPEVGKSTQGVKELLDEYGAKTMLDLPPEVVSSKCADDTMATLALYNHYLPGIDPAYFRVEMEVIPILIKMSLKGLKINQEDRTKLEVKLERDVAYYRRICDEEDFMPSSNQQVGYILAKRGNFLPFTDSKKQLKVSVDELEFLDDPIAAIVLNFRAANKLLTTYIKPLAGEDRIYTEYSLDIVVGRIQSSKMNMQNIPSKSSKTRFDARFIFEPDSGVFTTGDFSQEHLRILMHLSGDKEMQRVYYEGEHGGDIHLKTAKEMGISRTLAKTINYAIPYGATPWAVSVNAKIKDLRRCAQFIDDWFDTYRDAAAWIKEAQRYGLNHGKALPTLFGREIAIPDEVTRWGKLNTEAMKRKAVNYPIIGSDGEIMKRALIMCQHLPLAITVHDSITCDGDIEFPVEQLETISSVRIPFAVEKSKRWK